MTVSQTTHREKVVRGSKSKREPNPWVYFFMVLIGWLFSIVLSLLTGCAYMSQYERTYSVAYDADNKNGSISITLKPLTPTPSPQQTTTLNDATIEKILRLIEADRKKALLLDEKVLPAPTGKK